MYTYRATINRIVDGDTLDMTVDVGFKTYMHHRFRLMGYNAPETRGPERVLGLLAKKHLQHFLPVGTEVSVNTYKADAFGRYLADVYLDGVDVVAQLIYEGYGVAWTGKGKRPKFSPEKVYPLIVL